MTTSPTVMFAILARNKEHVLPRYLACVSSLTYSKKQIHLYIRTNNNEDGTEAVLTSWLWEHSLEYASVDFLSYQDPVLMDDRSAPHHWVGNIRRLRALAKIREESLNTAREMGVDFYFVCDCDNFIIPRCLSDLISLGLPIAGPLLLSLTEGDPFANFFLREEEMKDGYLYRVQPADYIHDRPGTSGGRSGSWDVPGQDVLLGRDRVLFRRR